MTHENPFKTVYKGDYIWPYIAPITFKPGKPLDDWEGKTHPEPPLAQVKMCQCDRHDWSPHFKRAIYLKDKEQAFREAMLAVAAERTILDNEVLKHPCAKTEDVLMSMYGNDFSKREFPVSDYRSMKKDHDDPVVSPVAMPKDPKTSSYRDTSSFKTVALEPVDIQGPRPLNFASTTQPVLKEPSIYTSEYMDGISKAGLKNVMRSQKFDKVKSRDAQD